MSDDAGTSVDSVRAQDGGLDKQDATVSVDAGDRGALDGSSDSDANANNAVDGAVTYDASPLDSPTASAADAEADSGPACLPSVESCNGKDDDCDQVVDEEVAETPLGTACDNGGQGACAAPGKYVCANGSIVCSVPVMPQAEVCDGIDNDCMNGPDDGLTNASCGGSNCMVEAQLKEKKGTSCYAGEGDCKGEGTWVCDEAAGNNSLRCTAVEKSKTCDNSCAPVPEKEDCSTPGDDNCNGMANEGCCTPISWYQDCDGDGYAATTMGAVVACEKPAAIAGCAEWTQVAPDPATKSNWDCADNSTAYHPGVPPGLPPDGSSKLRSELRRGPYRR